MVYVWTAAPRKFGQLWYREYPDDQRSAPLQWPLAKRYGALAQRSGGAWELWWFGPDDLEGPSVSGTSWAAVRRRFGSRMSRGPRPPRRSSSSRSAYPIDRTRRNA